MWSNLVLQQDEDGRGGTAALGKSGRSGKRLRPPRMSDSQEGKIKLAFFIALIGVTLMVLGMGTAFWVELSQPKHFRNNQTCEMAHYGLWKSCVRTLWVSDIDPERESCGPAELPGGESTHTHTHTHTCTHPLYSQHNTAILCRFSVRVISGRLAAYCIPQCSVLDL